MGRGHLGVSIVRSMPATPRRLIILNEWVRFLLEEADHAVGQGSTHITVIVSQMAAELATEAVVTAMLGDRDDDAVTEAIDALTAGSSWNLGNDRMRKAYSALTGDDIAQAEFWPRYRDHVMRRNAVMHRGYLPSQEEADESYRTVEELVYHVVDHAEQILNA